MTPELTKLIAQTQMGAPLSANEFNDIISGINVRLPSDYIDLMRAVNGFTRDIGQNYIDMWQIGRVCQYGRYEFLDQFLFFACDGGGEGFAFDISSNLMPIMWAPFIESGRDTIVRLASTVTEMLDILSKHYLFEPRNR